MINIEHEHIVNKGGRASFLIGFQRLFFFMVEVGDASFFGFFGVFLFDEQLRPAGMGLLRFPMARGWPSWQPTQMGVMSRQNIPQDYDF